MIKAKHAFMYKQLADEIELKIHKGIYQPGEKLPSIRQFHRKFHLSISTVYQAYMELETTGLIEARPKSGYYVRPVILNTLKQPVFNKKVSGPQKVELTSMVNSVLAAINNPRMLPLGSSTTSAELLPLKYFSRILKSLSIKQMKSVSSYSITEGNPELRRQLALMTTGVLKDITPDDIVVTSGCMEAVSLCLQAVLKPGDTLAIEAPTHFGFLQFFKEMGILVAEIPTHPSLGVDIDELEKTIKSNAVKACLFMPNFQNPLGSLMPDDSKKRLVRMLNNYEIPVIEDDICGEMYYEGNQRPSLLKAYDKKNLVMTCSSFSKTLAPGFRIGWVVAGKRFREKILRLKAGNTVCTSSLDQFVIKEFLKQGACERYFRSLRNALKKQTIKTALAIQKYFPDKTRLAVPEGGALLWVQLPAGTDSLNLYKKALKHEISILPGIVCSVSDQFGNYIRIGCGHPFSEKTEKGIQKLGELTNE
ncbi:PLP-dependent aminotransferase family protein, partial [Desulfobacterales bacterium HSG17]|nr:PLP-dependent aminotransferase family protein [Desulfobacterales bacterium HSG17]